MQRVIRNVWSFLARITRPLKESFLPKPRYLTGETVQQVIQMAGYRASVPRWMGIAGVCIFVPALVIFLLTLIAGTETAQSIAGGVSVVGLLLVFEAGRGWLLYNQWKFIVTDKRFILITPDPDRSWFADAIYLKGGKIQVLDTNLSKSPIWGFFQLTRGTRDVMLSMSGYEFKETGAQVKGGLRFPDVLPDDIQRLEELIFG
jgi:hypothetical protein